MVMETPGSLKGKSMKYTNPSYILFLCLFFLSGCFSEGPTVMIETDQPEDDFVVTCNWTSHFFSLHGGTSGVKQNVFVVSSGEPIECGTSWFGVWGYIGVSHPLYVIGEKYEKTIYDDDGEVKYVVLVYKSKLKEQYLDELIKNYKDDELKNWASRLGGFDDSYYLHYASVKKVQDDYFNNKYRLRMTAFWKKLLPIIKDDWVRQSSNPDNITVEKIVDSRLR